RTASRPNLPGWIAFGPEFFQIILVPQGIHRLPEAGMPIRHKLVLPGQTHQRLALPTGQIAVDVVDDRGVENEIPPIDPGTVACRLFLETGYPVAFHIKRAITPGR